MCAGASIDDRRGATHESPVARRRSKPCVGVEVGDLAFFARRRRSVPTIVAGAAPSARRRRRRRRGTPSRRRGRAPGSSSATCRGPSRPVVGVDDRDADDAVARRSGRRRGSRTPGGRRRRARLGDLRLGAARACRQVELVGLVDQLRDPRRRAASPTRDRYSTRRPSDARNSSGDIALLGAVRGAASACIIAVRSRSSAVTRRPRNRPARGEQVGELARSRRARAACATVGSCGGDLGRSRSRCRRRTRSCRAPRLSSAAIDSAMLSDFGCQYTRQAAMSSAVQDHPVELGEGVDDVVRRRSCWPPRAARRGGARRWSASWNTWKAKPGKASPRLRARRSRRRRRRRPTACCRSRARCTFGGARRRPRRSARRHGAGRAWANQAVRTAGGRAASLAASNVALAEPPTSLDEPAAQSTRRISPSAPSKASVTAAA